jgi:hypothetical protein
MDRADRKQKEEAELVSDNSPMGAMPTILGSTESGRHPVHCEKPTHAIKAPLERFREVAVGSLDADERTPKIQ